jgi:hypothetical protein
MQVQLGTRSPTSPTLISYNQYYTYAIFVRLVCLYNVSNMAASKSVYLRVRLCGDCKFFFGIKTREIWYGIAIGFWRVRLSSVKWLPHDTWFLLILLF